jgi:hypothetical protein
MDWRDFSVHTWEDKNQQISLVAQYQCQISINILNGFLRSRVLPTRLADVTYSYLLFLGTELQPPVCDVPVATRASI